jgi:multidrug efflux pump subunit AcrA (membrane-fusion protein)
MRSTWILVCAGLVVVGSALAAPASSPASPDDGKVLPISLDVLESLLEQIEALEAEVSELRQRLAAAELEAAEHARDAAELRQFVNDHDQFGRDYTEYQAVRKAAERESRRQRAEEQRQQREADQAERRQRFEDALARRAAEDAEAERLARYDRAGFAPLGLEVWMGRSGFAYHVTDGSGAWVDYDPRIGRYFRPLYGNRIDYSRMTISGSVLNSSTQTRNIGIAITFFDDNGNQVGATTVRVSNARPDVPYPFTETIEMALARPFDSSSQYVIYADPVE